MNRIVIDADVLRENLAAIARMMDAHGATWTLVTKVLCGHVGALQTLASLGVRSVGDTRLENLRAVERSGLPGERWYLRPPNVSTAESVVELTDVSLNSEFDALEALNRAGARRDVVHRVVIMVELGELREGVLPSSLLSFFGRASSLSHLRIIGLGANLGCLSGTVPTPEQLAPLPLYRRLIEHEFDHPLPLVSAGSSVVLSALLQGNVPDGVNHYRIGESVFLGTDLMGEGTLPGLRNAVTVEAEIVEMKEKNLVPLGEISEGVIPFENARSESAAPGERGYRALVAIGHLDTDVNGLTPLDPSHQLVGASSDISVVYLGSDPRGLKVGDIVRFRPDYSAFLRGMNGRYVRHEITGSAASAAPLPGDGAWSGVAERPEEVGVRARR